MLAVVRQFCDILDGICDVIVSLLIIIIVDRGFDVEHVLCLEADLVIELEPASNEMIVDATHPIVRCLLAKHFYPEALSRDGYLGKATSMQRLYEF